MYWEYCFFEKGTKNKRPETHVHRIPDSITAVRSMPQSLLLREAMKVSAPPGFLVSVFTGLEISTSLTPELFVRERQMSICAELVRAEPA